MRSKVPDPYQRLGTRTFLHPVVVSAALMPHTVAAYAGAPQSVCSDHFLDEPGDAIGGDAFEFKNALRLSDGDGRDFAIGTAFWRQPVRIRQR